MITSLRVGSASLAALLGAVAALGQTTSLQLPATEGAGSSVTVGPFAGGAVVRIDVSGTVNLYNATTLYVHPDGSTASVWPAPYGFANQGAAYPAVAGYPSGDGINHFPGGGCNYDFTGSGWMFAGTLTTDTTDPTAIRAGAVVGTWSASPGRPDWFFIGYGRTLHAPAGGGTLRLAVNESYSADNVGSYSVTVSVGGCAADMGTAGGLPGHDGLLNNNDFVAFINHFFAGDTVADVGSAGGLPGSDGVLNTNDFVAFINLFFSGC